MSETAIDPAIRAYAELPVSAQSPITQALMSRAAQEGAQREITITTEGDSNAPSEGLTQGMLSWYLTHIAPMRTAAISAAEHLAGQIVLGRGTPGVVERVKTDEAKFYRASRRATVLTAFQNKHGSLVKNLGQIADEHDQLRVQEGQRDAKVPSHFLEWGILLPLIMLPESLLNFGSFRRARIIESDAQALGVTIIVGIAIAVAAHLVGRFVRQFNFYMRDDDDRANRSGWPLWAIGSILLIVALGVVAYARYQYLITLAGTEIALGRAPPNIPAQLAGLLGGNLMVFLIGVGFTFMLHDSNPDFSDKARKLKKLQKQHDALYKSDVTKQLDALDRSHKEKVESITRVTSQMTSAPEYQNLRANLNAIEAKDREVIGVLNQYKQVLNDTIVQRAPNFYFDQIYSSGDRATGTTKVKLSNFMTMNPQLLWSQK